MKSEWKELAEKLLFDYGKQVLGNASGGLIVQLLKGRGIDSARKILNMASAKQDPREYVAAVLKEPPPDSVKIGDKLGGYTWNGSRWAENA